MLIGLGIRDLVLIESLNLAFCPGLTVLTGETGAGKSIILDALGLATGTRAEAALVRRGAGQAVSTAVFALPPDHPARGLLDEKGLPLADGEDLVLRRAVGVDGRSRAFINDQSVGVALLRKLGALLVEVHGQHDTEGLLNPASHLALLDAYAGCGALAEACAVAWRSWREASARARAAAENQARAASEGEDVAAALSELDRLSPRDGEEESLAEERRLLATAEKTLADVELARERLSDDMTGRAAQALRALEHARERVRAGGAAPDGSALRTLDAGCAAAERVLAETAEAVSAVEAVARTFSFEPHRLETVEERLFALRALARKLGVGVDDLAAERRRLAARLSSLEDVEAAATHAAKDAGIAMATYLAAAAILTGERTAAAKRLTAAVQAELAPLKLDKARFRVALGEDARGGPRGADKVEFEIATLPGAPFSALGQIASGGELARLALALKASLVGAGGPGVLIFDEVDQGVGGAVADAVGVRLRRLAEDSQVLIVTHSPQIAARADAHWRVWREGDAEAVRARLEALGPVEREEEIARMLSGARVSDAARAAARALIHA